MERFVKNIMGTTLIELMIVTVIIGMLATTFLSAFQNVTAKASLVKVKSDLRNIATACESYKLARGTYPGSINSLGDSYFFRLPSSHIPGYSYVVDKDGIIYLLKDTNGNGRKDPEENDIYTFSDPDAFTCSSTNL
jgi:type II secretory pathway pseudopilin PulG